MTDLRTFFFPFATLMIAAGSLTSVANAEPGEREGRRGPPQKAFEACEALVEGDACSFEGRRGEMEGSCIVFPRDQESLICAPADHPRHRAPREEVEET